jgi:proline iminopeptidase
MDQSYPSRRTALYPAIEPRQRGSLQLGTLHRMYWEESGNADGVPVAFIHGGPGAGSHAHHRRYFDPRHYRIVLFDQRGAGRSEPLGEVRENTTAHLIEDMERLREHLGIVRWVLFGGSWGSTLALAYAEAYPARCLGLILRGIFLCRQREIDWFLYGMRTVFPEAWRRFAEFLPESERGDLLAGYHKRLMDPEPTVHLPAARAWSAYEGACSTLRHSAEVENEFGSERMAFTLARIEAHFFDNSVFMEDDALIDGIDRLKGIPAVIRRVRARLQNHSRCRPCSVGTGHPGGANRRHRTFQVLEGVRDEPSMIAKPRRPPRRDGSRGSQQA